MFNDTLLRCSVVQIQWSCLWFYEDATDGQIITLLNNDLIQPVDGSQVSS